MKIISLVLSTLLICFNCFGQQFASLNMNTDGASDHMRMINESKVTEDSMSENYLIMKEQNANMNVELKWAIVSSSDPGDDYTVLLKNPDGSLFYGYQVSGGEISIHDVTGTFLLGPLTGPVPDINVVRCDNYIYYLFGDVLVLCREISDNDSQLNGVIEVSDAVDAYVDVVIQTPESCEIVCEQIEEQYLALEPFTDWREHAITEPVLKIKYVEKYSIVEGTNLDIPCSIRDNTGTIVFATTITNKYGLNLNTIPIDPGALTTGQVYTLCVSGINKGQEYCLKLRYDGD
ncbi:MAG: hypothetical protein WAT91_02250 [Saprospiraceae bacterium]